MSGRIWDKSWMQISEDLRDLQNTVDICKKRFEAAARQDTAEELEKCILLLQGAQGIAYTLALEEHGS